MQHRKIISVCSQIHTKHTHTLCGQKVELLNVKLVVQIEKKLGSIGLAVLCQVHPTVQYGDAASVCGSIWK
jgi:hypothetical protein